MKRSDLINYFGYLYLHDNMTANEIAKETGYSISTVKHYLSVGEFRKNHYYSNEELDGIRKEDIPKKVTKKKKCKVLTKDEMREMFKKEHQLA